VALTPRSIDVLRAIRTLADRGCPPSRHEIMQHVGIRGKSAIDWHLARLEGLGLVARDAGRHRSIRVTEAGRQAALDLEAAG
jgi:SOS-response transcriptional repressor LexA